MSRASAPFRDLTGAWRGSDCVFANLEVPLTGARSRTHRKTPAELRARQQFILTGDPRFLPMLSESGIRMVTLANNHSMDAGPSGIRDEMSRLDQLNVLHAGAGASAGEATRVAVYKTPSGVRIGLLSALAFVGPAALRKTNPATDREPGVSVLSFQGIIDSAARAKLGRWIGQAKTQCDILVVGLHWGIERQPAPTNYQIQLAHACVDAGANVIWGHHPHVLQGYEFYRGAPILYSMGNLISATPARSGLAHVTVDGSAIGLTYEGLEIRKGHPRRLTQRETGPFRARMQELCRLISIRRTARH